MKRSARPEAAASEVIGRVEVLEPKNRVRPHRRFGAPDDILLDASLLEHRLDDEVGIAQRGEVGARVDAGERRLLVVGAGAASRDVLVERGGDRRLALVGGCLVAVEKQNVDAGPGADMGDTRPHEAGSNDADRADRRLRHRRRAPGELVERVQRDEQRADHCRGGVGLDHLREVAPLHVERLVEGKLQALEHR